MNLKQVERELSPLLPVYPDFSAMGVMEYTADPIRLHIEFDPQTGMITKVRISSLREKALKKEQLAAYGNADLESKNYKAFAFTDCCSGDLVEIVIMPHEGGVEPRTRQFLDHPVQ